MNKTERKVHLFLTGEIQVGKSTIIRKFMKTIMIPPEQTGGFITKGWYYPDTSSSVHLLSVTEKEGFCRENCIMMREPKSNRLRTKPVLYPEVFETLGLELLNNIEGKKLLLMDELGFVERGAPLFRERVLNLLDGDVPILGVLKKWPDEFLRQVEEHPKVEVIHVTEENRDEIAGIMSFVWNLCSQR